MGGTGLVAVYIKWSTGQDSMFYVCKDRQGSIVALVKQNGTVSERFSYDAWGRRRNPANWADYNVPAPRLINRGYTGHEHLDGFGLINMNGRMYDPVIGRVLSPDNYVQDPTNTQSFNRYSYCLNNPLRYTDPSGWLSLADWNDAVNTFNNLDHQVSDSFSWYAAPGESDGGGGGGTTIGYMGPSSDLVGEPGKSVIENQYGRWEYTKKGEKAVWVQTKDFTQRSCVDLNFQTPLKLQLNNTNTGIDAVGVSSSVIGSYIEHYAPKNLSYTNAKGTTSIISKKEALDILKGVEQYAFVAQVLVEGLLYFTTPQSGTETILNIFVGGITLSLKTGPGLFIWGSYQFVKQTGVFETPPNMPRYSPPVNVNDATFYARPPYKPQPFK